MSMISPVQFHYCEGSYWIFLKNHVDRFSFLVYFWNFG